MADDLDDETRLAIYKLVINRYKDLISEKESRSISQIRQAVSPYNDFIRSLRERMLKDTIPYEYKRHFFTAAERALSYIRGIRTCEFAFTFWMDFKEMDSLRIATSMDKALLLTALLRAFESEDARVLVTRKGRAFVRFMWDGVAHVVAADSGMLVAGEEGARALFADDPVAYAFNDLMYENYEEV